MQIRLLVAVAALAATSCQDTALAAEKAVAAPVPQLKAREAEGMQTAIFAGGCFWGVEAVFSHTRGVRSAVSGYHGGTKAQARYDLVAAGFTDHREAVRIVYDPKVVRYDELLQIFFSVVADPTRRNAQGPDRGPQYDAALIPTSNEQRRVAAAYLAQMKRDGPWDRPILTGIAAEKAFYRAEAYHQDFARKNPDHRYIRAWDAPKVAALARLYPRHYRASFQPG